MRYWGVDLHRTCFTTCARDEAGKTELATYKLNELGRWRRRVRTGDEVAVEATGNTRYFVEQLAGVEVKVVVVDPNHFEVIKRSTKKTDAHDAQLLALFLSKGLLPEARMKDKATAQIQSLAQTRDKLVKLRTTLINKLHGIHTAYGRTSRKEAYSRESGLQEVLVQSWEPLVAVEIEVVVGQIRSLNGGIKRLEEEMAQQGRQQKGHVNLLSIKGIGEKSATILLSVIGKIEDFESEGKLASYFGIVPWVAQSNETRHVGRITKRGSKLGRTTLVQCTLIAKRYSPYLQRFYTRLQRKRGSGKAIIATARKFLGIIYRTLKYDWVFADFPNFVLAKP